MRNFAASHRCAELKTVMRRSYWFILLLSIVSVSADDLTQRIVGGEEVTDPTRWPWQGRDLYPIFNFRCGTSLINATTVVTAAHCTDGTVSRFHLVSMGVTDLGDRSNEQTRFVISIDKHPDYTGGFDNDLAIMTVTHPFYLNEFVNTIELGSEADCFNKHSECFVTGFGLMSLEDLPTVMQEAEVKLISRLACMCAYMGLIDSTIQCVKGTDTSIICSGDSGGPLVCRKSSTDDFKLIGDAVFSHSDCDVNFPSGYTDLTQKKYQEWLTGKPASRGWCWWGGRRRK